MLTFRRPPDPDRWAPGPYRTGPAHWTDLAETFLLSPFGVILGVFVALGAWAAVDTTARRAAADDVADAQVMTTSAGGGFDASTLPTTPLDTEPAALWLDSDPAGATVWIDGDSVGQTPALARSVAPGRVGVSFVTSRGRVDTLLVLTGGEARRVAVRLPGAARRAAPTDGPAPVAVGRAAAPQPRPAQRPADEPGTAEAPRTAAAPRIAEAPRTAEVTRTAEPTRTSRPPREPRAARPAPAPRPGRVGTLRVTSDPSGAEVTVDGRMAGRTPLVVPDLAPGRHDVTVAAPGFETARARPTLAAGRQAGLALDLAARGGFLEVSVAPGSTIDIDGQTRTESSGALYRTTLPQGTYRVSVSHPGSGRTEQDVEIRAGVTFRITFERRSS